MKSKVVISMLCLGVALAMLPLRLSAQALGEGIENKRIGTAAATELLIPVGARDLAMGGSSLATSAGIDALHWNPAGLGRLATTAEGTFTTMSYLADIRLNYGAVGVGFGSFGVVGLSIRSFDFGDILLTTNDDPEGRAGRTFAPTFVTVGLTYSRAFTDAITAGGTVKIISEKMGRASGGGFALDFGVQYHTLAGIKGLHLGVAMKNIGPQMSFSGSGLLRRAVSSEGSRPEQYYDVKTASFELPSSVEIGLAYERTMSENLKMNFSGAFANNNLGLDGYRGGAEALYQVSNNFRLAGRAGIEISPNGGVDDSSVEISNGGDDQIFGPALGFGFLYKTESLDITLDYAYRSVDFFDSNQMFTLKLGF